MARKNLLKGLIPPAPPTDGSTTAPPERPETESAQPERRVDPRRPRYSKGAIGAVGQSIAELKSRSVIEIDPHIIDAGGLTDRLEHEEDEHAALMASLETYGQQVPILVRPHPDDPERYQIVYGRRRVLALRDLGLMAKAMVRDLDDTELVMAQGQENTARRDLSFIEKCNFARQMRDAGYDRKAMCDALNIDKTLISRMLSIIDRVGVEVVETVGAANGVGRDRWALLADRMEKIRIDPDQVVNAIGALARGPGSVDRFEAALLAVRQDDASASRSRRKDTPRARTAMVSSDAGLPIARITRKSDALVLTLPREGSGGFEDWLADNLQEFHRSWVSSRAGRTGPDEDPDQH